MLPADRKFRDTFSRFDRARLERRKAFARRVAVRVCAGLIALFFVSAVNNLFINPKPTVRIPLSSAEAFEIPAKTLLQLQAIAQAQGADFPEMLTVYSFENDFFPAHATMPTADELEQVFAANYSDIKNKYPKSAINQYYKILGPIIGEMQFFPIPAHFDDDAEDSFMYGDSWRAVGELKREIPGTDIYDREDTPGRVPVVSVCAGVVKEKKWDDTSGYMIKITAPGGDAYTYSHLNDFNSAPDIGKPVAAGQPLGTMGNTGLGKEGTKGNMRTHLHFSIQPAANKAGVAVINPYPFLRLCENRRSNYAANGVDTSKS